MGQADSLPNISRRLSACATSDGGRLMCTVNWLHEPGGYQLFCNRDEKLTRAAALPPRIRERDEIRYIAPVDGDFGGAWIGSNEFGVSICLLNGIGEPRGYRSRGLLIPDLLSAPSVIEVSRRVCQLYLSPFAAFTLAILEPGEQTTVIEWNGQAKKVVSAEMPLVSSSFDPAGVRTILLQKRGHPAGP